MRPNQLISGLGTSTNFAGAPLANRGDRTPLNRSGALPQHIAADDGWSKPLLSAERRCDNAPNSGGNAGFCQSYACGPGHSSEFSHSLTTRPTQRRPSASSGENRASNVKFFDQPFPASI